MESQDNDKWMEIPDFITEQLPTQYRGKELNTIPPEVLSSAWEKVQANLSTSGKLSTEAKKALIDLAYVSSGSGSYFNTMQSFLTTLDRYGSVRIAPNIELSGLTFMTRPRLCLRSSNLRNTRTMTALDTLNTSSIAFMIRALLDTNLINGGTKLNSAVTSSPLFDHKNPFMVPLCNSLLSFSGSPNLSIEIETTDGGYMSEAQSFALGSDSLIRGNHTIDCNFRDVQGGPITAIIFYWMEYIRCVTRGIMLAYPDDIDQQVLNYTVSFYRFLLDPTGRYITKWAKYTGCFPISISIAGNFNKSAGKSFVDESSEVSVGFACNIVEYMDYAILMDFNNLVRRYCPDINKTTAGTEHEPNDLGEQTSNLVRPNLPIDAMSNLRGLPYITSDRNGIRIEFRQVPNPVFNDPENDFVTKLMCISMQQRLKGDIAYAKSQEGYYTPELLKKSEQFSKLDMNKVVKEYVNSGMGSIHDFNFTLPKEK